MGDKQPLCHHVTCDQNRNITKNIVICKQNQRCTAKTNHLCGLLSYSILFYYIDSKYIVIVYFVAYKKKLPMW